MFFYIGNSSSILALKKVTDRLYVDEGWNQVDNIWYKGYSTDCILSEQLSDIINGYQPEGKWCVIHNEKVYHPVLRGFPLYRTEDNSLTNLKFDNSTDVYYNEPDIPVVQKTISLDEASEIIGDILLENTINFYKYNKINEMNVLYSAGLDTLTSWAVLDYHTKDYTLNIHLPNNNDNTFYKRLGRLREYDNDLTEKVSKEHWGYGISSFYKKTNWYLTGYYAETIQFRDGEAINALANHQGKRIDKLAKVDEYLYWFLKRPNIVEKYKNSMIKFSDETALKEFLFTTIYYDHQMWHMDNNMTFNPFFDVRIANTMVHLSLEDITKNCTTGLIQRKIVERFNPQLLSLLADYKNERNIWGNFKKNWPNIKLDPLVKIKLS
jgi:hypothetical protein